MAESVCIASRYGLDIDSCLQRFDSFTVDSRDELDDTLTVGIEMTWPFTSATPFMGCEASGRKGMARHSPSSVVR